MKKWSVLGAALALTLPLLAAVRPAAAAQAATVVAKATGATNPFSRLFVEDAQGNVTLDNQKTGAVQTAFSGLPYVITSDGKLEIGSATGSGLHLLATVQDVSGGKGLYYIVHGTLPANGGLLVNGRIFRDQSDLTKGNAFIALTIPEQGGAVESAWVHQDLTFASSNPSPSPTPTPTPGHPF